ncbi:cell wall-binding repeat-containing protein [Oceanobacillus luteolus]|uniref:cell wall-binding repeat-containing protein n=1 Tax=Oceanobacillus luteolus TaxID=1274358 RepID=UPI00203A9711|nr:cell wall-binding repeat-containing protein [Oceanobacillus luteolus]MCM3742069.1 cell wall-binding repeat-containing protein [Oceanobacillus luteolus]
MKKLHLITVYAIIFIMLLPTFTVHAETGVTEESEIEKQETEVNEEEQKDDSNEEEYNEFGIKKGLTVYGIDLSELTEEELQYVPEAWLDGDFEEPHGPIDENYVPEGITGSLQSIYPNVNKYIENMEPARIEYQHKPQFKKFPYRKGVGRPEGVVAHDTGNPRNDKIENEIAFMERNWHNAFVHAFVDHNRIIEIHPPDYGAWGAGPIANQRFIHVELVNLKNFHDFALSINNYAYYIATLLKDYDLGVTSAELKGQGTLWSHLAVSKWLGGTNSPDPHNYFERWGYSWYEFTQLVVKKYDELSVSRISGSDRYQTAVKVSQDGWNRANTVVLARGDEYADALAGVPLAGKHNAPLLLTQSNKLTDVTEKEIKRLGAKTVYLLGGEGAISKSVENKVKKLGVTVKRISGNNRIGTASAIAKEVGGKKAVVVNGYNFPDALSVAAYAAQQGMPILLTQPNRLPAETKATLANYTETLVVGGTGAVSKGVMDQLPKPKRVSGNTRYATTAAVAKHFNLNTKHYYVATGKDYPDALSSAALAAKNKSGVLLVNNGVPWQVRDFLQSKKVEEVTIIGGKSSVPQGVQNRISDIIN